MRPIPIAVFKDEVRKTVAALLNAQPRGFYFAELAARLGEPFASCQNDTRRLRHQLDALCDQGVLMRIERGIYIGRDKGSIENVPDVRSSVWRAFWNHGGCLTMPDLMAELAPHPADPRAVRDHLWVDGRYTLGIPLTGFRRHWVVREEKRREIPLPGSLQLQELRLIRLRRGSLPVGWGISALGALRERVGAALAAAREMADLTIGDLAEKPKVAGAMQRCLMAAASIRPSHPVLAERHSSFSQWWEATVQDVGQQHAIGVAWRGLEGDEPLLRDIQAVLDVRCWEAIGYATGLDPAALSRGALRSALPATEAA